MNSDFPLDISNGQKYRRAMLTFNQDEADLYFERCVRHAMARGAKRDSAIKEECQRLLHHASLCNDETRERVCRLFIAGQRPALLKEWAEANFASGERVITVRMGSKLHAFIQEAAHFARCSMNGFCIAAISDALDRDQIAAKESPAAATV